MAFRDLLLGLHGQLTATLKGGHSPNIAQNALAQSGSCRKNYTLLVRGVRMLFVCTTSTSARDCL
eukprot:scaffold503_cov667-Pavlova_lutheri.AAC.2